MRTQLEMNSSFHFILKLLSLLKTMLQTIDQLHLGHLDINLWFFHVALLALSYIH
jgi:hypothetical protein